MKSLLFSLLRLEILKKLVYISIFEKKRIYLTEEKYFLLELLEEMKCFQRAKAPPPKISVSVSCIPAGA